MPTIEGVYKIGNKYSAVLRDGDSYYRSDGHDTAEEAIEATSKLIPKGKEDASKEG